jgi:hypothetical protein
LQFSHFMPSQVVRSLIGVWQISGLVPVVEETVMIAQPELSACRGMAALLLASAMICVLLTGVGEHRAANPGEVGGQEGAAELMSMVRAF